MAEKGLPLSRWRSDAERDADATRAPTGYYPSARILRLIEELERAIGSAQRFGDWLRAEAAALTERRPSDG